MTNLQAIDLLKGLEQSLDDYCELNDEGKTAFGIAITALELFGNSEQLPSAQPEKRTEERTEMHACDCISRQAAIDAIVNTVSKIGLHDNSEVARYGATFRQHEIIDIIEGMPSAQPEIVRCKDCKHRPIIINGHAIPPKEDDEKCPFLCDDYFYSRRPGDNFFCANAERTAE